MTENLSHYVAPEGTIPFEGIEKLRLNDYHVCELLQDYVISAISWIEGRDMLVHKVVISSAHVRAYPPPIPEGFVGPIGPEYIEIKLPRGLYERAVDLSMGPLTTFPVIGPTEEVKLFLGRLQQVAFPDPSSKVPAVRDEASDERLWLAAHSAEGVPRPTGKAPKTIPAPRHIVMNAMNFTEVRKWLSSRFDPCTTRDELSLGFQGILWETDEIATYHRADQEAGHAIPPGRSVKVWLWREIPMGSVAGSPTLPRPFWQTEKLNFHALSEPTSPAPV